MCLTIVDSLNNICFVKTVSYIVFYVNDGNNFFPRSHDRSHDKALNNNKTLAKCERVNDFSCAHTRAQFSKLCFSIIKTLFFCFFPRTRECFFIHLFTFKNNKLKNNNLPCERLSEIIHTLFTRSHIAFTSPSTRQGIDS